VTSAHEFLVSAVIHGIAGSLLSHQSPLSLRLHIASIYLSKRGAMRHEDGR
jgi:hypothetical protein